MPNDFQEPTGQDPSSVVFEATRADHLFGEAELFRDLNVNQIRELSHVCTESTYEPGDVLFSQGEEAKGLYVIEAGEVEVRIEADQEDDAVVLARIGSGGVVGEMAILDGSKRSATVHAISETHVFVLSRDSFEELRRERRVVAYKLIMALARMLGERRRATDARVAEVFASPEEHIDAFEQQVHELLGRFKKA